MQIPMIQVEILGRRADLDVLLHRLQRLRAVQPAPAPALVPETAGAPPATDGAEQARVERLRERVEALLALAPSDAGAVEVPARAATDDALEALLERIEPQVAELVVTREVLRGEQELLPSYVDALAELEPLVPELSRLTDAELAKAHLATVALVLDDPGGQVIGQLTEQLTDLFGDRFLLTTTQTQGSSTVGALLVTSVERVATVERLLGSDQISQVSVPGKFSGRSLTGTVAAMRDELAELPDLMARNASALEQVVRPVLGDLLAARRDLAARAERLAVADLAAVGERTFALRAWLPQRDLARVEQSLRERASGPVVVVEVDQPVGPSPVLLQNPRFARPFERLVGFLAWPRNGERDPTVLMALVFPFMFGVMVGDVAYGLILVAIGWVLRRRLADRNPFLADVSLVLVLGGWWSVLFGFLFGELLGNFGRYAFDFPALWFYRGSPDALTPLLLFVLAVGAAHVLLGLVLGVWASVRDRHLRHAAERLGTLVVLVGLFGIAAVAVAGLPETLMTPSVALLVIGVVLAVLAPGGAAGLLAPLELISAIGKVLSYLRLAAVGLASVYLAVVANELAAAAPLLLGIVVATFFHALNVALAAFSPMIQSLRLHYVEFLPTFYDGGGDLFTPFGAAVQTVDDGPHPADPASPGPPGPASTADPAPASREAVMTPT